MDAKELWAIRQLCLSLAIDLKKTCVCKESIIEIAEQFEKYITK